MKFEMDFGWTGNEKIVVETFDFEKIQIIQEFIQFQEEHGWEVEYEAIDDLEDEFEEDAAEEVIVAGLDDSE
jgi:F0F1-type ATP synthase gamma subunit